MTDPTTRGSAADNTVAADAASDIKSCCAAVYSSDLVRLLAGDRLHPGGAELTRTVAARLGLVPGARVLDVACGRGQSARQIAVEHAVNVIGVDLSPDNVTAARAAGPTTGIEFRLGDAEALPFPDAGFDAVLCECALCTFPDKHAALAQIARVLRPGGRLGLSDVTVDPDRLPDPLRGLAARVACIADARPRQDYLDLLTDAGLQIEHVEDHDHDAAVFVERLSARLLVARLALRDQLATTGIDIDAIAAGLEAARAAIADGALGYVAIIASRPGPHLRPGGDPG